MSYNRTLYTASDSAIDAAIVYDQSKGKMQNEINASMAPRRTENFISNAATSYGRRATFCASDVIEIYLANLNTGIASGATIGTIIDGYRPAANYAILPVYSNSSPYQPIGSLWIYNDGTMKIYFTGTPGYVFGTYIANSTAV